MPTDQELMALHLGTRFTSDANSRLLHVNEPCGGPPAASFFMGRTKDATIWRFRADLPEDLVRQLEAFCLDEPIEQQLSRRPRHFEAYLHLLERYASIEEVSMGPAYQFSPSIEPSRPVCAITAMNAELLGSGFEKLRAEVADWQPFFAMIEDGKAVSVCRSVRITARAHEAGVETLPEYRGKGYAKDAVAAWARSVRSTGARPLYSTCWENCASRALAVKLRLIQYGVDFQIK